MEDPESAHRADSNEPTEVKTKPGACNPVEATAMLYNGALHNTQYAFNSVTFLPLPRRTAVVETKPRLDPEFAKRVRWNF
jgi:hypothetical protein